MLMSASLNTISNVEMCIPYVDLRFLYAQATQTAGTSFVPSEHRAVDWGAVREKDRDKDRDKEGANRRGAKRLSLAGHT